MACTSITWAEIDSWLRVTELELSVWERMTIKIMSEVYASELSLATDKARPAPYTHIDESLEADRALIASNMKNVFAAMKLRKAQNE